MQRHLRNAIIKQPHPEEIYIRRAFVRLMPNQVEVTGHHYWRVAPIDLSMQFRQECGRAPVVSQAIIDYHLLAKV